MSLRTLPRQLAVDMVVAFQFLTRLPVPQVEFAPGGLARAVKFFPVVGLAVLVFTVSTTLAWRRFGQSFFEMAAMPGALGGTLEGMIQVPTRLQPEHGLHLRLSCLRR